MNSEQDDPQREDVYEIDEAAISGASVDDFIKQLEEREKDLHITAETTLIEIADSFDDVSEIIQFVGREPERRPPVETVPAVEPPRPSVEPQLRAEIGELQKRVRGLEAERADIITVADRRLKDLESYRARTERERGETFQNQVADLAGQMLPALDNLDRALDFAARLDEEHWNELGDFFRGIELVNQQMLDILAGMGVEPITAVGRPFDPQLHEAVALEDAAGFEANTVCGEMLRGYKMNGGRVIRHSMVKVASAAAAAPKAAPPRPPAEENIENRSSEPAAPLTLSDSSGTEYELEVFNDPDA